MKSNYQRIMWISLVCLYSTIMHGQTNQTSNVLFIFDASGSMWGKLGNSTKIQVAKETMGKLTQTLSDKTKVGLIAYGHKSVTACNDIETLIPLLPLNKSLFTGKINALNPKGKTPIALSTQHALNLIKDIKEPVTIILVSDGLETCEGNACEIVSKAKAIGAKITVHVVGFGIAEKDLSPLECIVQAGGGQFFPANDAAELATALEKSVASFPAGNAFLSIKTTLDGNLKDSYIKVFKTGQLKEVMIGRTYEKNITNPRIMQLPAGNYSIEVEPVTIKSYPALKFSDLKLTDHDTLFKRIEFERGTFEIQVTRNNALSDATVQIYTTGTSIPIASNRSYTKSEKNPVKIQVPPGIYDIVISSVEITGKPEIKWMRKELESKNTLKLTQDFKSGELLMGAKQGAALVDATINIIHTKTGKSIGAGRTYQTKTTNPKSFILEPDNYTIELKPVNSSGLPKKSIAVEVEANKSVEKTIVW